MDQTLNILKVFENIILQSNKLLEVNFFGLLDILFYPKLLPYNLVVNFLIDLQLWHFLYVLITHCFYKLVKLTSKQTFQLNLTSQRLHYLFDNLNQLLVEARHFDDEMA